jgi:ABC-type Fe3+/spermidine/putrescine transport system ATPase subunit
MVFQRYALFPHLTVAENVGFGLKMRSMPARERPARVAEVIELVRLKGLEERFPHQLSGGQQAQVSLAVALGTRAALLLLDEPLANLDRRLRDEMRIELKRIQQEARTTMLFVTHDQEEALTLGDRIAVMHEGRLEQVGRPIDIYRAPASKFVASFIGDMNFLPAQIVREAPAGEASLARLAAGGEHAIEGRHPAGGRVVACVRPERVRVGPAAGSDAGPASLRGAVKYAGFSGDSIRYVVELAGGVDILVREAAVESKPPFAVGDVVGVAWADPVLKSFPA